MGAELCLAIVLRCYLTTARIAALKAMNVSDPESDYEIEDVDEFIDDYASESLTNSREVTWISLRGASYYVTGGMSWGDNPSDAYGPIAELARLFFDVMEAWSIEDEKKKKA